MPTVASMLALAFALAVTTVYPSASGSRQTPGKSSTDDERVNEPESVWLDRLKTWSQAVTRHVPGRADAPVLTISEWTADEVTEVVNDVRMLRRQLTAAAAKTDRKSAKEPAPLTLNYRKHLLTVEQLRGIRAFDHVSGTDANQTLKLGAMLHADIALLAPVDRSRGTGSGGVVRSVDGRVIGFESQSVHWLVGRQLLDDVKPDPAADSFVRLWYHATSASLLTDGILADAEPHLDHAIDVLPEDADIQYEDGVFHQASAAPAVQAAMQVLLEQSATPPTGARALPWTSVFPKPGGSEMIQPRVVVAKHREEAARQFRRAVELDPHHVEARMRLGHALLELGRAKDAVGELQRTVGATTDPTLSYLSALLLGRAEAQLGRLDAAVERYTRAAALFPQAQSPPLALAQLAHRRGDRASAQQFVRRMLAQTRVDHPRDDPWWTFGRWQLKSAEMLLAELRALAQSEPKW